MTERLCEENTGGGSKYLSEFTKTQIFMSAVFSGHGQYLDCYFCKKPKITAVWVCSTEGTNLDFNTRMSLIVDPSFKMFLLFAVPSGILLLFVLVCLLA